MQKFTIKTVGKTNIYELDETKKTLLITRKKYGRTDQWPGGRGKDA